MTKFRGRVIKLYPNFLEGDEEQYRADIYDAERRASDETRKS